jgi:hypothetical protein
MSKVFESIEVKADKAIWDLLYNSESFTQEERNAILLGFLEKHPKKETKKNAKK